MGWNAIEYEEVPWHIDPDHRVGLSKTARRKIGSTYRAAVPLKISGLPLSFSQDINARIVDITAMLARFDEEQRARGCDLPALLLRSESAASSQIENLASSVRNVAIAEISDQAPKNAQLVSGNMHLRTGPMSAPSQRRRFFMLNLKRSIRLLTATVAAAVRLFIRCLKMRSCLGRQLCPFLWAFCITSTATWLHWMPIMKEAMRPLWPN